MQEKAVDWMLTDIRWDVVKDQLSKAKRLNKDGDFEDVDLTEKLFQGGVSLFVIDCYHNRPAFLRAREGTVEDILKTIQDFYCNAKDRYKKTHGMGCSYEGVEVEDVEEFEVGFRGMKDCSLYWKVFLDISTPWVDTASEQSSQEQRD